MTHQVCRVDDLPLGKWQTFNIAGRDLLVGRTPSGRVFAMRDYCPHFGAKLSAGVLEPLRLSNTPGVHETVPDAFVMRCPWHGFEFSLDDGRCIADHRIRTRTYKIHVEGETVFVDV